VVFASRAPLNLSKGGPNPQARTFGVNQLLRVTPAKVIRINHFCQTI
jgi:hypothetical protein